MRTVVVLFCLAAVAAAGPDDLRPRREAAKPSAVMADFSPDNLRLVGSWPFGPANDVAVDQSRNLAFLGSGGAVLVMDLSDPAHPVQVGLPMLTGGRVEGLALDPALARLYVCAGGGGLEVWSVADPQAPARLGAWAGGTVVDAATSGSYCYVVYGELFGVVDVSDPATPRLVGTCGFDDVALSVAVYEDVVLVGVGDGLCACDVSNPAAPRVVGRLVTDTEVSDVATTAWFACLADDEGVKVVSVADPRTPRLVGTLEMDYYVLTVAARGATVYAGCDEGAVALVDIADPTAPVQVDVVEDLGSVGGLELAGSRVLAATGREGLVVLDLVPGGGPRIAGQAYTFDVPMAVAGQGGYACVADGSIGLTVMDVRFPGAPEIAGYCMLDGEAVAVAVKDSFAYVADAYCGLQVVSIARPDNPVEVGSTPALTGTVAVAVSASGRFAYVFDDDSGFVVVEVALPSLPVLRGRLRLAGNVEEIAAFGEHCALAAGGSGLRLMSVADPLLPAEVGRVESLFALSVAVDESSRTAWVGCLDSVVAVDVADPAQPVVVGSVRTGAGEVTGVALYGNLCLLSCAEGELVVLDVTDRTAPEPYSTLTIPDDDYPVAVAMVDSVACVLAEEQGLLTVLGLGQQSSRVVGNAPAYDLSRAVAMAGSHALVASGYDGLRVLDLSNRAAPREAAVLDLDDRVLSVAVSGSRAFVGGYFYLSVVDVADPARPALLGRAACLRANGVAVADTLAFVAQDNHDFVVYSVADPAQPYRMGSLELDDDANDVAVAGGIAYVADDNTGGLYAIDVSAPWRPVKLDSIRTGDKALGVAVQGGIAYVADEDDGLTLVDVSDPANLRLMTTIALTGDASKVRLAGARAFVALEQGGVAVVDVADTANLEWVGWYDTPGSAYGLALDLPYVVVADYYCGVTVLEYEPIGLAEMPAAPSGHRLLPSVVRGVLSLRPSADGSRQVLLDACGRRVRDLKPGDNDVSRLAPGVYFVRGQGQGVRGQGADSVTKVVITR
ncbi:MAG: hypothetical protein R6X13_10810 [bacterium]